MFDAPDAPDPGPGQALEPWQTGAPMGQAAPTLDPSTGLPPGARPDPRDPNLIRNADGSIYGIGDFSPQAASSGNGPVEITIGGTTSPESISGYLHAKPEMAAPPPGWVKPPSGTMVNGAPDQPQITSDDWRSGAPAETDSAAKARDFASGVGDMLDHDFGALAGPLRSLDQGTGFGFTDEAKGAITAGLTGLANATGNGPGFGMADAYKATVDDERAREAAFQKQSPAGDLALQTLGAAGNPLSALGGGYVKGAEGILGVLGRSAAVGAGQGALYGAGNATGDLGSRVQGAMDGAKWGGATGLALPVVGAGLGAVAKPFLPAAGNAGAMGSASDALSQLGIPMNSLPDDALARVQALAAQGMNPGDAAIQAAGKSLPVPVPMSRGQITGEPGQQLNENMILRGARGEPPQRLAKMFQQEQQQALRGNVDQIGANMTGGFPTARGQAGQSVSDALNAARDQQWSGVNAAYDAARDAPAPAYLQPADAHRFVQAAKSGLADFDVRNVPRVQNEVQNLENAATPWAKNLPAGIDPARISRVSGAQPADIRTLFNSRARLSQLRASSDPVESAAASSVVNSFDKQIDASLTSDLFQGDPQTVDLWRKAIGARADFGKKFEANDLVQKLTARQGVGGTAQLKVDPHDASNYIFGRSNLGFVGRQNLYRGLNRLRGALGADSDAWNRVRGEAFSRIAGAGEGPMELGASQFSGAKFAQAWGKAKTEDPQLVQTLFAEHERNVIDRFAAVSARVTKPVTGGDNSSNTAVAAAHVLRAVKRLPFLAMESTPFIDHLADKIDHAAAARSIRAATYGAAPRRVSALPSAGFASVLQPALTPGVVIHAQRKRQGVDQ